jgi:hypothetical protein
MRLGFRIANIVKEWRSLKTESYVSDPDGLTFAVSWVDGLLHTLKRHRNDKDFCSDIVLSAHEHFVKELTDQEQGDVFAYLLGLTVRS